MLLTISVTVIAASMIVVIVFLTPAIVQISRTARQAEKFLETARMQIVPLTHDLTVISRELSNILQSIHRQVDKFEEGIAAVQDAAERLREFEEGVLTTVEEPLLRLTTLIRAANRGFWAFWRYFQS